MMLMWYFVIFDDRLMSEDGKEGTQKKWLNFFENGNCLFCIFKMMKNEKKKTEEN